MKRIVFFLTSLFILLSCQQGSKNESSKEQSVNQVQLTEVTLQIGGMHCDMCPLSIEKGVNELPGISYVKASLADSNAVIHYDKQKIDLASIEKAVEKRGYTVKTEL